MGDSNLRVLSLLYLYLISLKGSVSKPGRAHWGDRLTTGKECRGRSLYLPKPRVAPDFEWGGHGDPPLRPVLECGFHDRLGSPFGFDNTPPRCSPLRTVWERV